MDGTRFIKAGSLIDGSGADVRKNMFLEVKDGIITSIDSSVHLSRQDGVPVDDFSHCIILPALVDCCVSLSRSPAVDGRVRLSTEAADPVAGAARLFQHIRYCHAYGVLGVAENDEILDLLDNRREEMELGRIIDIRRCERLHPDRTESALADSAAGEFLKIGYTANIEDAEGPFPLLDRAGLYRILQHKGGRKAVAVANGSRQVGEALEAGCDAIEQGYGMGEENLRKMADTGVLWIPSVLRAKNALDGAGSGGDVCCRFSQRYVAPGTPVPGAEAFWQKILAEQLAQLRSARKMGVPTALGTGAGSIGILHGESMVEEMKLFIKAGYSLSETFRCASENGARFFNMEKLGQLAVGRQATFLIARGTVQQLPRKLSYLEGIYVDGMPSPAYRKIPF